MFLSILQGWVAMYTEEKLTIDKMEHKYDEQHVNLRAKVWTL